MSKICAICTFENEDETNEICTCCNTPFPLPQQPLPVGLKDVSIDKADSFFGRILYSALEERDRVDYGLSNFGPQPRDKLGIPYDISFTPIDGDSINGLTNVNLNLRRVVVIDQAACDLLKWLLPNIHPRMNPIQTTGDGFCMNSAISTLLFGTEMFFILIRKAIRDEMMEYEAYYRGNKIEGCANKMEFLFDNAIYYNDELDVAKDLEYNETGMNLFSEIHHLFPLANILKRPIIIYGCDGVDDSRSYVYLPLRIAPDECYKRPLVLAFANKINSRSPHVVPLVKENDTDIPSITTKYQPNIRHTYGVVEPFLELRRREYIEHDVNGSWLIGEGIKYSDICANRSSTLCLDTNGDGPLRYQFSQLVNLQYNLTLYLKSKVKFELMNEYKCLVAAYFVKNQVRFGTGNAAVISYSQAKHTIRNIFYTGQYFRFASMLLKLYASKISIKLLSDVLEFIDFDEERTKNHSDFYNSFATRLNHDRDVTQNPTMILLHKTITSILIFCDGSTPEIDLSTGEKTPSMIFTEFKCHLNGHLVNTLSGGLKKCISKDCKNELYVCSPLDYEYFTLDYLFYQILFHIVQDSSNVNRDHEFITVINKFMELIEIRTERANFYDNQRRSFITQYSASFGNGGDLILPSDFDFGMSRLDIISFTKPTILSNSSSSSSLTLSPLPMSPLAESSSSSLSRILSEGERKISMQTKKEIRKALYEPAGEETKKKMEKFNMIRKKFQDREKQSGRSFLLQQKSLEEKLSNDSSGALLKSRVVKKVSNPDFKASFDAMKAIDFKSFLIQSPAPPPLMKRSTSSRNDESAGDGFESLDALDSFFAPSKSVESHFMENNSSQYLKKSRTEGERAKPHIDDLLRAYSSVPDQSLEEIKIPTSSFEDLKSICCLEFGIYLSLLPSTSENDAKDGFFKEIIELSSLRKRKREEDEDGGEDDDMKE